VQFPQRLLEVGRNPSDAKALAGLFLLWKYFSFPLSNFISQIIFNPEGGVNMEDLKRSAEELFQKAYILHMAGELDKAIELYEKAAEIYPTAQIYTFMGWAYSMKGDYETAIELCLKAIELDPDFGNPYNDIGSYLIALGRYDEAVPWLKKAITAALHDLSGELLAPAQGSYLSILSNF
jgi:tetratricopeptide (TPR) repeat protein